MSLDSAIDWLMIIAVASGGLAVVLWVLMKWMVAKQKGAQAAREGRRP